MYVVALFMDDFNVRNPNLQLIGKHTETVNKNNTFCRCYYVAHIINTMLNCWKKRNYQLNYIFFLFVCWLWFHILNRTHIIILNMLVKTISKTINLISSCNNTHLLWTFFFLPIWKTQKALCFHRNLIESIWINISMCFL